MSGSDHSSIAYRADIDALRALAVGLVVVFHGFPKAVPGGFIGVDIFFVISGFLITSIIVREQAKGSFSILKFYSRRIRRLFPALITIFLFCLIAGWLVLYPDEYRALGYDMSVASAFILNWKLAAGVDYFAQASHFRPLLHLWTLSVEEQFYVGWPMGLIVLHKLGWRWLWWCILLAGLGSFVLNLYMVERYPHWAFFHSAPRLGIGSGGRVGGSDPARSVDRATRGPAACSALSGGLGCCADYHWCFRL